MLDTVEGVCGYTVIQCIQPKSGYNADTMADTKVQSILGYKVADLYAARTAVGREPPVATTPTLTAPGVVQTSRPFPRAAKARSCPSH